MTNPLRSSVLHFADAQANIPGPAGEHAVTVLQRGTLDVALSLPLHPRQQTPHAQDELYFIIRGRGVLIHDGKRDSFQSGDLLFVAAGIEHQLEDISEASPSGASFTALPPASCQPNSHDFRFLKAYLHP